ncbi:MAG: hypothetical protein HC918_09250 [Oscillatoriales cyanobacterium SM2_1_8]|nr:hypothetical protein [Oscillatoriales cyanobacterium SM2_1_8]
MSDLDSEQYFKHYKDRRTQDRERRKQSGFATPRNIKVINERMTLESSWNSSPTFLILVFMSFLSSCFLFAFTQINSFNVVVSIAGVVLLNLLVFGVWLHQADSWIYEFNRLTCKVTIRKVRLLDQIRKKNLDAFLSHLKEIIREFSIDSIKFIQILEEPDSVGQDTPIDCKYKICFLLKDVSGKQLPEELSQSYDLKLKDAQILASKIGGFLNVEVGLESKFLNDWLDEKIG